MERMRPADTAWYRMDQPANRLIITGVLWFEDPIPLGTMRDLIEERIVGRYPRFRQRVVGGGLLRRGPWWAEDVNFDLDRHLHHVTLPDPGGRHELQDLVSTVMSEDLPRDRPLWQLWMADGYAGGCAVVARIHHCLADGISLAQVLLSITDDAQTSPQTAPDPTEQRRNRILRTLDAPRRGVEVALHPSRAVRLLRELGRDGFSLGKLVVMPPDHKTALRGHLTGTKQAVWSDPFPLEDVKRVGRHVGATVNDVLLATMAGALGRLLDEVGTPAEEIRAFVPYNLRPLDEPVPVELGNEFGLVLLGLPVGIVDPVARIAEVHRRMLAVKSSPDGLVSYGILATIGHTPSAVERLLVEAFGMKGSAVMTNVPGPRQSLFVAGTRVAGVIAWVPSSARIGLGVSIFSYAGEVVVGVAADQSLVDDPSRLVDAFHEEFERLGSSAWVA
jgi:diacylglycerol O-acyltransferase / wax synthase